MKNRIFTKVDRNVRDRLAPLPQTNPGEPNNQVARQLRLRDLAFESSPLARIVVNHNGILSLASQKAKTQLGLISSDIGRALQELEIYYRPAELRPLIEQAYVERRTVTLNGVERRFPDGEVQYLDVQVVPIVEDNNTQLGAAVTYFDVTHVVRLQEELQRVSQELETSSEELQSTNEE
ncbi:MAG TPA: PAS domain-containing protein, partial [Candidatus Binatia bacterium]|nr:PAS domain-containing protein [Candidatus Binatia bacterium]